MASPVISDLDACERWILAGSKPAQDFRVGTEYERLLIGRDGQPLPWDGEPGIRQVLEALAERFGWAVEREGDRPIALLRDGASVTLEPAGQFELSGAPLATITDMRAEMDAHLAEVDAVLAPWGARSVFVGLNPLNSIESAPKMPKGRYGFMRAWMPKVGGKGLQMMHLTCTVQSNLDFSDGADAMSLLRAGFLSTPVMIALFANSPWRFGASTTMASTRADIWLDVDPARCDVGDLGFDPNATVRDYVEWAADVPMYFVPHTQPDGSKTYLSPEKPGGTFRDLLNHGDRGRAATEDDWLLHLSTLFPDARLKRYVEIRAADCVEPELLPALPALSFGLLSDPTSRQGLFDLMRDGDASVDRAALRAAACQHGLDGKAGGFSLRDLSLQYISLASAGIGRIEARTGVHDPEAHAALARLKAIATGERRGQWQETSEKLDSSPLLSAIAQ
ncbi:MAG: glutamate--cysteine ligase [Myxococcales bacterium]|nr:glutamate--cysteine ligase [Myxococcales bacterium]